MKLLLSAPNNGSDWLADLITETTGWTHFRKEFFNPLTNRRCGQALARGFGCELVSCYEKIAVADLSTMRHIWDATWAREDLQFNKEVFSLLKAKFFVEEGAAVVALYRQAASVFPPSRLRVWQWYDAIWQSLNLVVGIHLSAHTLEERAYEAHRVYWALARPTLEQLKIPILDYERLTLISQEQLEEYLSVSLKPWGDVPISRLAARIVETRREKLKLAPSSGLS